MYHPTFCTLFDSKSAFWVTQYDSHLWSKNHFLWNVWLCLLYFAVSKVNWKLMWHSSVKATTFGLTTSDTNFSPRFIVVMVVWIVIYISIRTIKKEWIILYYIPWLMINSLFNTAERTMWITWLLASQWHLFTSARVLIRFSCFDRFGHQMQLF